jgi:hypothetical protein
MLTRVIKAHVKNRKLAFNVIKYLMLKEIKT